VKQLMSGNVALGEAAILSGCTHYFGYPITPQNEITEYMARRLPAAGGVFIQSESEIAAINMVLGAAAAGARAMTSSSGPGMSLKQEGISYLVADELPGVIVNVVRGGPGMGSIAGAQSDYFQATRGGGHGDYRTVVLAPSSVQELTEIVPLAFELADKALTGAKDRPPQSIYSLIFDTKLQEEKNWKLQRKFRLIEQNEVRHETHLIEDADMVVVAYGIGARIAKGAIKRLRDEGKKVGLLRPVTLWPFPAPVLQELAKTVDDFFVFEMSAGQMVEDVRLALEGQGRVHFYGRPGGVAPMPVELYRIVARHYAQAAGGRGRR